MSRVIDNIEDHSLSGDNEDSEPEEEAAFPTDAFVGPLNDMAEAVADTFYIDPAISYSAGLAAISGALGKSIVATKGSNHGPTYANLYVLISARTSAGKGIVD